MSETDRIIQHYIATEGPRVAQPFPGESDASWNQRRAAYLGKLEAVAKKLKLTFANAIPEGCTLVNDDGNVRTMAVREVFHAKER